MNIFKKAIFPILLASAVQGGERETFDFGWTFKYFGSVLPELSGLSVKADASQRGHEAVYAVDGDLNTRWCASNAQPGHFVMLNPDCKEPLRELVLHWEKPNNMRVVAEYGTAEQTQVKQEIQVDGADRSTIPLGDKTLTFLKLTFYDTGGGQWAGVREIQAVNALGHNVSLFGKQEACNPADAAYDSSDFKAVQLPHDWAIESPFLKDEPNETGKLPWTGYGWYRKVFDVPADFDSKTQRYYLDFDGVMSSPKVYVNGRLAGEWAYGYNSFRVDITPFLQAGRKNLIAVMAGNQPLSTRWYPGAGIYRHVWLEKCKPVHLGHWGVFVTTPEITAENAKVQIQTAVDNTGDKTATVKIQQKLAGIAADPITVTIAPGASRNVIQTIQLPEPRLWSCDSPYLYKLQTTLSIDGRVTDSRETSFGVRTVKWDKGGFYLNGERVQLKGVCEHHDLGPLGAAFYERAFERKIETLKSFGCNAIRAVHNPPAPEVLDLCDKHGILVIDELFDIWKHQKYDKVNGYHVLWQKWWKKDVRNFVMRDRNHPCIILWSGGNEIPEIHMSEGQHITSALKEEFRKYDPTRLFTVGVNDCESSMRNGFAQAMDVFGFNYRPHFYGKFRDVFRDQPYYGAETCSCVATRGTYFFPLKWNVGGGAKMFQVSSYGLSAPGWGNCPDIEFSRQGEAPDLAGEFVWTGFDYLGEPTPYNQDQSNATNFGGMSEAEKQAYMKIMAEMGDKAPSRSSYFGIVDLAGFPKDTCYLYQSRWLPDLRQAHILPHWNWPGREGQKTPVMVYSSGDEAELFVNGKSQGVCKKGDSSLGTFTQRFTTIHKNDFRFVWEDVPYEPGELRVVVRKNGSPWAEATRMTTGEAVKLHACADRARLIGDARDLVFVTLSLLDQKGREVPTDCRKVSLSVSGPIVIAGACNGDPTDHTCMQSREQAFFNGRILVVLRGKRAASGNAKLVIKAEGLDEVAIPIEVTPASQEQLLK